VGVRVRAGTRLSHGARTFPENSGSLGGGLAGVPIVWARARGALACARVRGRKSELDGTSGK
jgi:hypothetical protein